MELVALGIADSKGQFVTRALDVAVLTWAGLEGDRHAGLTLRAGVRQPWAPKGVELRNTRQLSLVSEEELAAIATELSLARLDYRWLGANLLLRGAPQLTALLPGSRLVSPGGAVVVIDGENEPCRKAGRALAEALGGDGALASRFVKAARGRRGLVGWVERPGVLRPGDSLVLHRR
ncbi:MAG: MOSC domain-containing protein [Myxococcota bacterium]